MTPVSDTDGVEARLARLEERTQPKPKSLIDAVKDWSGVATAVIALLYTFPLGVWDKFVANEKQKTEQKVDQLRGALLQLSDLEASTARSYGSIQDPQIRSYFSRAMASQRAALLFRVDPLIRDHSEGLSVPELILLGYNLGQAGQPSRSQQIYDNALRKADLEKTPAFLFADIYRMKAQLYALSPDGSTGRPNMVLVRSNYASGLRLLLKARTPTLILQASNSAFEWALFEHANGDWRCGEQLGAWAQRAIAALPFSGPEAVTLQEIYRAQLRSLTLRPDQTQKGCDPDALKWQTETM